MHFLRACLCSLGPCADDPLLFLLSLETDKKEAAENYNDGKELQKRKGKSQATDTNQLRKAVDL